MEERLNLPNLPDQEHQRAPRPPILRVISPHNAGRAPSGQVGVFVQGVMALTQDGAAILDMEGRIQSCNRRLGDILARPPEALRGRPFAALVMPDDVSTWRDAREMLRSGKVVKAEITMLAPGERPVPVTVGLCPLDLTAKHATYVVVSDGVFQRERVRQLESMLSQLEEQRDELELAVTTDTITGAYSVGALSEVLRPELKHAQRNGDTASVLVADVDEFKLVNDEYGHGVGDCVLKEFCDRCRRAIRATDYLIRYGGDEFVVVLPRTGEAGARAVADRIWNAIRSQPFEGEGWQLSATVSIGVATAPRAREFSDEELLQRADAALYDVKRHGRDGVRCWTPETPVSDRTVEESNDEVGD